MLYRFHHTSKYQYVNVIVNGFNLISNYGFNEIYFIFDRFRCIGIDKTKIFDYHSAFIQRLSIQNSFTGSTLTEFSAKSDRWCAIAFNDTSIYLYNFFDNERISDALNIKSILIRLIPIQDYWIPYLCSRKKRLEIKNILNRYLDFACTLEDINRIENLPFSSERYSPVVNTIDDLNNINTRYVYIGTVVHVSKERCNYVYDGNLWNKVYERDNDKILFYDNKPHVVFNEIEENNIILNIIQNTINNNTEVK